jgi:hypothetical protein
MDLLRLDDFLDVFDVLLQVIDLLERGFLFGGEMAGQLCEEAWQLHAARIGGHESGQVLLVFTEQAAILARPATLSFRSVLAMRAEETLTLLSTLPTLCSTPVATSAMPARRADNVLKYDPSRMFHPPPRTYGGGSEHRFGPKGSSNRVVQRHHDRRRDENAPITVETQKCQGYEHVKVRFDSSAR